MKLTMKGFLLAECNRLLDLERRTTSLKKMYRAAAEPAGARAREYVFLFAVEADKLDALLRIACAEAQSDFSEMCKELAPAAAPFSGDAEGFLAANENRLNKRFLQVSDAFHAPEAHRENNEHVKRLMREKTLKALREVGVTPYMMVRDLGLNKGNAYAYLRGDVSKVSRATARRMYDYALSRG